MTGSFKAEYFHCNIHSICDFNEYNYFSKVTENVRGYDTENDIFTERHYLKYVFRIFLKTM